MALAAELTGRLAPAGRSERLEHDRLGHGDALGLEQRPDRPLRPDRQVAPEAPDVGCQLALRDRSCCHDSRISLSRTKLSMRNIATRTMFVQSCRRERQGHRNDQEEHLGSSRTWNRGRNRRPDRDRPHRRRGPATAVSSPMSSWASGSLEREQPTGRSPHEPAQGRVPRRVAVRPQGAARRGEGDDPGPRRAEREAPACCRWSEIEKDYVFDGARRRGRPARPVRRPPPADRQALHVRADLGDRLPELHRRRRRALRRAPAPPARPRDDARRRRHGRRSRSSSGTRPSGAGRSRSTRPTAATSTTTST